MLERIRIKKTKGVIKNPKKNKKIKILRKGFYIERNIGNNAFFYKDGRKIYVAPLIEGTKKEIAKGEKYYIREDKKAEQNKVHSEKGLKFFVLGRTERFNTPIFLCDNHNYVLEIWRNFKKEQLFLVHIDQHKDTSTFSGNLENIYETQVNNYIDFAIKNKWIKNNLYSYTESKDLKELPMLKSKSCILNIDLDFFAPENNLISLKEKINLILYFAKSARIITLATSPLFINQKLAIRIARLFWEYL